MGMHREELEEELDALADKDVGRDRQFATSVNAVMCMFGPRSGAVQLLTQLWAF